LRGKFAIAAMILSTVWLLPACRDEQEGGVENSATPSGSAAAEARRARPQPDAQLNVPAESPLTTVEEVGRSAEMRVGEFARKADEKLSLMCATPWRGWSLLAALVAAGVLSLLCGWAMIKSFMVPFAPVWGLSLGAVTAFCLIQSFYQEMGHYRQLAILGAGAVFGLSIFLFAALKAKPVAAFLFILSPFLVAAALLFDTSGKLGLIIFIVGFIAGFAAMIEIRPIAVVSTSLTGALLMITAYGLLSHLLGERAVWLRDSFAWLLDNALMLVVSMVVLTFLGTNFQFTTGPRGTLEQ
jgi:hypothetical protein